jgi:ribosome biogenesis protein UTP30
MKQLKSAAKVLKRFSVYKNEENKLHLLEDDDKFVTVNILLSQVPVRISPKPLKIPIPHPIYGPEYNTRAVLFIKDPERAFLDKIEDLNVPCLAQCIPYKRLKKDYERYHDKKDLINEFQLYFSDIRVYKMLPKPLGKFFYIQKKFPYPADLAKLQGPELETAINDLFKSTYFHIRNGPNYTLRVARTSMTTTQIAENVISAVNHALPYVMMHDEMKHSRVQSISLRVGASFEVPVYNHLLTSEVASYLVLKDQVDENGNLPKQVDTNEQEEEESESDE